MGWGTGTAALEAKVLQKLTVMREAVLSEVFLDLWKAYNADRVQNSYKEQEFLMTRLD